jgi:hypothetical protein
MFPQNYSKTIYIGHFIKAESDITPSNGGNIAVAGAGTSPALLISS